MVPFGRRPAGRPLRGTRSRVRPRPVPPPSGVALAAFWLDRPAVSGPRLPHPVPVPPRLAVDPRGPGPARGDGATEPDGSVTARGGRTPGTRGARRPMV